MANNDAEYVVKKAEDVLHLFSGEYEENKGAKKGYFVICPFHQDVNPSLHIYDSERSGKHRLMVKCFGCGIDAKEILNFINSNGANILDPSSLKAIAEGRTPKKKEEIPLTLTNTYTYRDDFGNTLYQVLRFEPKTFRYRRPTTQEEFEDTGKEWAYSSSGFTPTLYNRDLIHAVREKKPSTYIFKVAGEGKADLLRTMKIVGTCNTFGETTGKWLPEYAELLKDLNVVLIPDNDLTGYNHIHEVAENLLPVVNSLKIIVLPRLEKLHDDIKDWFKKYGGTKEELLELLTSAEELKDKTVDYIKEKYPYTFIDEEKVSIDLSILDELLSSKNLENESIYSEKLMNFLQRGREILDSEDGSVGLCEMCLNTGFVIGKNDDGQLALLGNKTINPDSEAQEYSVALTSCNHGNFEQTIEDFNF